MGTSGKRFPLLLTSLLVVASITLPPAASAASCGPGAPRAAQTLCAVNQARAAHGLPALTPQRKLDSAADRYAAAMVQSQRFAHVAVDGSTPAERARRTGYMRGAQHWLVGECIAWGAGAESSPQAVVQAWLRSPGHRRLVLSPRMTEAGVGVVSGSPAGASGRTATYALELGWRAS